MSLQRPIGTWGLLSDTGDVQSKMLLHTCACACGLVWSVGTAWAASIPRFISFCIHWALFAVRIQPGLILLNQLFRATLLLCHTSGQFSSDETCQTCHEYKLDMFHPKRTRRTPATRILMAANTNCFTDCTLCYQQGTKWCKPPAGGGFGCDTGKILQVFDRWPYDQSCNLFCSCTFQTSTWSVDPRVSDEVLGNVPRSIQRRCQNQHACVDSHGKLFPKRIWSFWWQSHKGHQRAIFGGTWEQWSFHQFLCLQVWWRPCQLCLHGRWLSRQLRRLRKGILVWRVSRWLWRACISCLWCWWSEDWGPGERTYVHQWCARHRQRRSSFGRAGAGYCWKYVMLLGYRSNKFLRLLGAFSHSAVGEQEVGELARNHGRRRLEAGGRCCARCPKSHSQGSECCKRCHWCM